MSMIGNWRRVTPEQLAALQAQQTTVSDFLYDDDGEASSDEQIDLDKAWHAIHFLLNGEVWTGTGPLKNTVLGGTPISEEDVGYGPARFLTPEEVQETSAALQKISATELVSKYDAEQFMAEEIYPQHWSNSEEDCSYISAYYQELVDFFLNAARKGDGLLLYIN